MGEQEEEGCRVGAAGDGDEDGIAIVKEIVLADEALDTALESRPQWCAALSFFDRLTMTRSLSRVSPSRTERGSGHVGSQEAERARLERLAFKVTHGT